MAELNARIIAKASATGGEVPSSADLEVAELAVNTADATLYTKHTDGSIKAISGGGGDVESVFDLTDVDYNYIPGGGLTFTNKSNGLNSSSNRHCPNPGDWASYKINNDIGIYLHKDSITPLLVTGSTVTLSLPSTGDTVTGVVSTNATSAEENGVVPWALGFVGVDTSEFDFLIEPGAGPLEMTIVSSVLPGEQLVPVQDGQVLAYDATRALFLPTANSDAVDSVNGETGAVSLGIQDMDDYQPQYLDFTYLRYHRGSKDNPGELTTYTQGSAKGIWMNTFDQDGTALADYLSSYTNGDPLWYLVAGGGSWQETTAARSSPGGQLESLVSDDLHTAADQMSAGQEMWISVLDPNSLTPGPLVEGDILQWNDADQKFKPAQVAQSIQGMDDFELNAAGTGGAQWNLGTLSGNSPSMVPGGGYSVTQGFRIHGTDNQGVDRSDQLNAWISTLTLPASITFVLDGAEVSFNVTNMVDEMSATGVYRPRLQINCALAGSDVYAGQTFSIKDFDAHLGVLYAPLENGDFLQWNDAEEKFKPAQVAQSIQGMDDFELNAQAGSFAATYTVTTSDPGVGGFRQVFAKGYTVNTSINGLDPFSIYQVNDVIWMQTDTMTSAPMTITDVTDSGGGIAYLATDIDFTLGNSVANLTVYSYDPALAEPSVPLAEGDILQWSDAEQVFKPSSDHISLTTLKSEVAASADFADFQSRIAAL